MTEEKYSASLVSQMFWLVEMKKVIKLISEGKTEKEIKRLSTEENLFGVAKEDRAKRIYGCTLRRIKTLDEKIINLFEEADPATQKVINLIAIMKTDRLFFEFVYEVYREKNIIGSGILEDMDVNVFFKNKEVQSEDIVAWSDVTKRKLRQVYITFLTEANLLTMSGRQKMITPPILDSALERCLEEDKYAAIKKAIMGVN